MGIRRRRVDGPSVRAILVTVTGNGCVCEWCGVEFERRSRRGPAPRYCSAAHRQRSHEARVRQKAAAQVSVLARAVANSGLQAFEQQLAQNMRVLEPTLEIMQQQLAKNRQVVESTLGEQLAQNMRVLEPTLEIMQQQLAKTFGDSLAETLARAAVLRRPINPPNWPDDVSQSEVRKLIGETGWSLTYVPRAEIISTLLNAETGARGEVLLAHAEEITADCRACLGGVTQSEVSHLVNALRQALDALDAGFLIPAQATLGPVLSEVINKTWGLSFAAAAKKLEEDPGLMPMPDFWFWLIASTIPRALGGFHCENGDEVPDRFNRHAIAHTVDPRQYTKLNTLAGLLLVTGLVRHIADDVEEEGMAERRRQERQPQELARSG